MVLEPLFAGHAITVALLSRTELPVVGEHSQRYHACLGVFALVAVFEGCALHVELVVVFPCLWEISVDLEGVPVLDLVLGTPLCQSFSAAFM